MSLATTSSPNDDLQLVVTGVAFAIGLLGNFIAVAHYGRDPLGKIAKLLVIIWTAIIATLVVRIVALGAISSAIGLGGILIVLATSAWLIRDLFVACYWAVLGCVLLGDEVRRLRSQGLEYEQIAGILRTRLRDEASVAEGARPASPSEVARAIIKVRLSSDDARNRPCPTIEAARSALHAEGLFWYRRPGFVVGKRQFLLKFDVFRFLIGPWKQVEVGSLREGLLETVGEECAGKGIRTIVYLERGGESVRTFFDALKDAIGAVRVVSLPASRWPRGMASDQLGVDLKLACGGEPVLLVDPCLIDPTLDLAYDAVVNEADGQLRGIAVLFEVQGYVAADNLKFYQQMVDNAGIQRIEGHLLLDLMAC